MLKAEFKDLYPDGYLIFPEGKIFSTGSCRDLTSQERKFLQADAAEFRRACQNITGEGSQQSDVIINVEGSCARVKDNRTLQAREQAKKVSY